MDSILIIDADAALRQSLRHLLDGHVSHGFAHAVGAAETARQLALGPALALVDLTGKPAANRDRLLAAAAAADVTVLGLIRSGKVKDAVAALKAGALDVLELPTDLPRLAAAVKSALGQTSSAQQAAKKASGEQLYEMATLTSPQLPEQLVPEQPRPEGIEFKEGRSMIGASDSLRHVFALIAKLAKVETSVLIRGESGTGKELVAQALHFNSLRASGPFVSVNCGAIPDTLIESELFGHEKGAFTGADRKKVGKFEYAQGGTIFLDEIGDISAHMQVKLLRVLQEKKFIPLGSNKEVDADVRVISATNKPLEEMIASEDFRSDLFYRLNVLPIHLPPLRDRQGDIKLLTDFLIAKFNRVHCRDIRGIAADALGALQRYRWPGNIRELENAIEHAFIMETGQKLSKGSLPRIVADAPVVAPSSANEPAQQPSSQPQPAPQQAEQPASQPMHGLREQMTEALEGTALKYPALKEQFEKWFLQRALKAHNGRINQTAEGTQMTKVTLLRKLEKYGINPKEYRNLPPSLVE